jgi:hypothetical protein
MIILQKNCEKSASRDKTLPRDSYIVTYESKGKLLYDIVQSSSTVEIFDYYYDEYRKVLDIRWTDGTVNPKIYGYESKDKKKKK